MSSHMPWNRIPQEIGWNQVGNGSIYNTIPMIHETGAFWSNPPRVQAAYGTSIVYALNTLTSFVQHYGNKNLVMIVLGDHQPLPIVSGTNSNHDVPISIIAHDPKVLKQIGSWGWNARPASPAERAGVADERVPQQVPRRLRLAPGDPVAVDDHARPSSRQRLAGLDGIRGLAALYVVINHVFLRAFPGYPVDHAPFWAGWFIYGRFAVVVFIVLSGFSLALSPARHGWRLDGIGRFARAAGPADPAGVLGRARLQPRSGVADRPAAGTGGARREVGPRQRPAGAEHRRRAQPQRGVLVDGGRGPAIPRCSRCCC